MPTMEEQHNEARRYYEQRYEVLRFPFVQDRPIQLRDHEDDAARVCRFCGQGKPLVTFRSISHAVPEFLGNKSILSLNECDECNQRLADRYEDHLSKWTLLGRAASQVKGKNGFPTFKNPSKSLKIGVGDDGLVIHLTDPGLTDKLLKEGGPYKFTVPEDGTSQPYIPIRAAMALIKIGCSICPPEELAQVRGAIDWLMERNDFAFANFPILYAFTPGPIGDAAGEAILLRRKVDGPEPYLWCLVQYGNHRFQTFLPFCPADNGWFRPSERVNLKSMHYPSRFGHDWPYGPTNYGILNWSGRQPVRTTTTMSFHVERAVRVGESGTAQSGSPVA